MGKKNQMDFRAGPHNPGPGGNPNDSCFSTIGCWDPGGYLHFAFRKLRPILRLGTGGGGRRIDLPARDHN